MGLVANPKMRDRNNSSKIVIMAVLSFFWVPYNDLNGVSLGSRVHSYRKLLFLIGFIVAV